MASTSARFFVSQPSAQPEGPKAHRTYRGWLPGFLHAVSSIYSSVPDIGYHFYLCHDMRKVERNWKPFNFLFFPHRDLPESEVCFIPVAKLSSQDFPSLPFPSSGLDLLFSWIPCFLFSGFTLTFS